MEGMSQENAIVTNYNYALMAQLEKMNATMNSMQAQLKTLSEASTNSLRPKRKYYCLELREKLLSW